MANISKKALGVIRLTRIEHSLMLALAVIAAEIIALGRVPAYGIVALSIIAPILVSMGAFAINDYYDVEIDRANKKLGRPLVSGVLSKRGALQITAVTFIIGLAASLFVNIVAFAIAAIFAALAYLYSYRLKHVVLVGNVYIAFTMVIPFIYGNYAVTYSLSYTIVLISLVVFLSGLARELHGMIRDYSGDVRAGGIRNVVYRLGISRSAQLAFILYVEAILISVFMFFFSEPFKFNLIYAVPIIAVDAMLAYVATGHLLGRHSDGFFSVSRNLSLGAMSLGIIAYLLAAVIFVPV
ncbi:UbiA family prenyltransferase [Candidatus Marsarchaeota archaeon]|nr:UbiA family prenyltransferase [Candidatus Marsarchaeota archaeon]MCL5405081.1 UbiA family prenyltransferase [Candidatus Marsarchaeota archaeon]